MSDINTYETDGSQGNASCNNLRQKTFICFTTKSGLLVCISLKNLNFIAELVPSKFNAKTKNLKTWKIF